MRFVKWLPLTLVFFLMGCPSPNSNETAAPAANAPTGSSTSSPSTPAADPIVGKWEIKSDEAAVVFNFTEDGKVNIDQEATRAGLRAVVEKKLNEQTSDPTAREAGMKKADEVLDEQMKQFESFNGTWVKEGDLYKLAQAAGEGSDKSEINWAKVDGDQLIRTDEKGEPKKDEPVATRVKA